jgi:hypothetical protein
MILAGGFVTFHRLVMAWLFPVSETKKSSERITIRENRGSHTKSDETTESYRKMVSKSFMNALPKGTTVKEMLCKQKFCVLDQFRERVS